MSQLDAEKHAEIFSLHRKYSRNFVYLIALGLISLLILATDRNKNVRLVSTLLIVLGAWATVSFLYNPGHLINQLSLTSFGLICGVMGISLIILKLVKGVIGLLVSNRHPSFKI